ncbi:MULTISPECIES: OmpH family outer membrane protein [Chitinophagaceae]
MKKVLLGLIAIVGMTFMAISANAQTGFKYGIFDAEQAIQALPEFAHVDSLLQIYQKDSIGGQYDIQNSELHRLDSTYKADSAAKKPATRLEYLANQRQQIWANLVNWNQIAQRASQQKYLQLAQPLYMKVVAALQKVCTAQHVALVLKPDAIEQAITPNPAYYVDLYAPVAKELGIKTNDQQGGAAPASATPARKPAGK